MGIKTSLNIKIIPMKNIFCQIYITEINDYVNESVKNKDMTSRISKSWRHDKQSLIMWLLIGIMTLTVRLVAPDVNSVISQILSTQIFDAKIL